VFPVRHDRYGIPDAPRFPHDVALPVGTLREFPLSTLSLRGLPNLPIGGGGYLRIYPFWFTRWGLRKINRGEGQPVVVYLHPWEIDPEQPRVSAPRLSRWRHYTNLNSTARRIDRLLGEFRFAPMRTVLGFATESAPTRAVTRPVGVPRRAGYAQAMASNGSRHTPDRKASPVRPHRPVGSSAIRWPKRGCVAIVRFSYPERHVWLRAYSTSGIGASIRRLTRMIDLIGYRGPDARGVWNDGPVGLAHARLSIIDLSGGAQPMANRDGSLRLTFNGEIFNYIELREQLERKGHRFQTHSDTEVILHNTKKRAKGARS
jgi:hypothetical protein